MTEQNPVDITGVRSQTGAADPATRCDSISKVDPGNLLLRDLIQEVRRIVNHRKPKK